MSRSAAIDKLVRDIYEAPLTPAEFDERVRAILADAEEKQNIAELIEWFMGRYPTVEARLRYARKHAPKRAR